MRTILLALFAAGFTCTVSARSIWLTADTNSPDPNQEITVYVHTDTSLYTMELWATVSGDAQVTAAMSNADCNQYSWDPSWYMDSYFDEDGYVAIGGVAWPSEANGVVGYFTFRYGSGQVAVSIWQEYSQGYPTDFETIDLSTDTLYFGEPDPNQMMPQENEETEEAGSIVYVYPDLVVDHSIDLHDFAGFAANWGQSGTGLDGDFDTSGTVDYNDLTNIAHFWLEPGITQYGITWIFDKPLVTSNYVSGMNYLCGQFVNGDWWVLGPVNIVEITPASIEVAGRIIGSPNVATIINGSMLDPPMGFTQGYDSDIASSEIPYDDSLNVARYNNGSSYVPISANHPVSVPAGSSLVSTISLNPVYPWDNDASDDPLNRYDRGSDPTTKNDDVPMGKYTLQSAAVLTVLGSIPRSDSFRPSYYGGITKTVPANYNWENVQYYLATHHDEFFDFDTSSQINLTQAVDLNVEDREDYPAGCPVDGIPYLRWPGSTSGYSPPSFLGQISRIWLDHVPNWDSEYLAPKNNMTDYGSKLANKLEWATMLIHVRLPAGWSKDDLLKHFIQKGIDWAGAIRNQGKGINGWWPDGGHNTGHKWPVMFAAITLNDDDLLKLIHDKSGVNVQALYDSPYDHEIWDDNALFPEDGQTFIITQTDIDLGHQTNHWDYLESDLNLPEYGMYHVWQPFADDRYWVSNHRQQNSGQHFSAFALAALIMGQKGNWNHNAFFDYTDRFVEVNSFFNLPTGNTFPWKYHETDIARYMWESYRDNYGSRWTRITPTTIPDYTNLMNTCGDAAYLNSTSLIFSDDFENNSFDTGCWDYSQYATVDAVAAYPGTNKGAKIAQTASIEKFMSTLGLSNIHVQYKRKTSGFDSGEYLYAEWSVNGSTWNNLESPSQATSWGTLNITCGSGANNNAGFRIRFRTNANATNEYACIDEVSITGTN